MFCKHNWKLLTEVTTKSKFELSIVVLSASRIASSSEIPPQLCDGKRKHIQTFTCTKCGKLQRFVEEI